MRGSSGSAATSRTRWSPTTTCQDGRHQRRVDQVAGRHPVAPGRAGRRDRRRHGRGGRGQGARRVGLEPSEVDLVIVATCSPESPLPNVAATVAYRLGIPAPGAYDLNAACAGFCYAIAAAADSVRSGSARNVLVIGAEKMTSWSTGPTARPASSSPTGRGRRWSARPLPASRPGSGRSSGARRRPGGQDRHHRPDRGAGPGRAGRLPLGDHRHGTGRARGLPPGRGDAGRHHRLRPHQANLRIIEAIAQEARHPPRAGSPTTSSPRATPRRPPCRWRWPGWPSRASCSRARPRC